MITEYHFKLLSVLYTNKLMMKIKTVLDRIHEGKKQQNAYRLLQMYNKLITET